MLNDRNYSDAVSLVARIYRVGNEIDDDLTVVAASKGFADFLSGTKVDFKVPIFDLSYYVGQLGFNIPNDVNPVFHFCTHDEGASPHLMFDPIFIKSQAWARKIGLVEAYVQVLENQSKPYIKPNLYFDPDLWMGGLAGPHSPIVDFLGSSDVSRRRYSRYFSPAYFSRQVPYLSKSHSSLFIAWLALVKSDPVAECNPMFHSSWYRKEYNILSGDPLGHFVAKGAHIGNLPNPFAVHEIAQRKTRSLLERDGEILLEYIEVKDSASRPE